MTWSVLLAAAALASPPGGETVEVHSLAMLAQVAANLEESVAAGDLAAVHYQDMVLYPALGQLFKLASEPDKSALTPAVRTLARAVADLHAAADAFDLEGTRARLVSVRAAFEQTSGFFDARTLAAARELADRFTCPMHPDVVGPRRQACAKCGMALDQRVRLQPFGLAPTGVLPRIIEAKVRTDEPLSMGREAKGVLKLTSMGLDPVKMADLREVHTKKIHLLIVDDSLTDYHHEHPSESEVPGEYRFTFTPRKNGAYRAWADVQPLLTGLQEYAAADIPSPSAPAAPVERTYPTVVEADGLRYQLSIEGSGVQAGQPVDARIRVTGADGKPFTGLEPLMGAFAHLVGFREDRRTVLHMHPMESRRLGPDDRGGPELRFRIFAEEPGYYRLFLQVQISGRSRFVPFGIDIEKGGATSHPL
jgi:hypothetical protein